MHLITGLIWHVLQLIVIFGDFLPFIEAQHPPIKQLIVLFDVAPLLCREETVVEPLAKISPNWRKLLFPTDVKTSIK